MILVGGAAGLQAHWLERHAAEVTHAGVRPGNAWVHRAGPAEFTHAGLSTAWLRGRGGRLRLNDVELHGVDSIGK